MRHLILTITLVLSNVALAQQEVAITPAAALSRGNVVCSTAKTDLTVKGEVFSDLSTGVNFSYADGKKFRIKFVSKTHNQDNIVSVTGELVTANAQSKAKSTFSMTEAAQNREFQMVKYTLYRPDGSSLEGSELVRCPNLREIAEILP